MAPAFYSPYRWLSPGGTRGRLTIFIFHRVMPQHDPMLPDEPDSERFDRIARFLASYFDVMTVGEAARRLEAGKLPAAAAAITFDDGYADNLRIAAPILKRHGLVATFFIATGYTDGGRMWNDSLVEAMRIVPKGEFDCSEFGLGQYLIDDRGGSRLRAFHELRSQLKYRKLSERSRISDEIAARAGLARGSDLMMTRAELVELKNMGMEIGGHTVMHPILASMEESGAAAEIGDGRAQLAEWLGEAPEVFAYPNGSPGKDYTQRDVELVRKAGYRAAVSVKRGCAGPAADPFQLPRFTPWDSSMLWFGLRCAADMIESAGVIPFRQGE